MNEPISVLQDHELVERLAFLPKSQERQRQMNHLSFASKFAHFFVDTELFPIYDSFAAKMLIHHLGSARAISDGAHPYRVAFITNFKTVKERAAVN
jgi:hypothetical protein